MTDLTPPEAVVFDLDGVVTFTARVHFAAWKDLFDDFLSERASAEGSEPRPFTLADYRDHVDGRPRYDGVRAFLASRGIELPEGGESDPPGRRTVHGLGRQKDELFRERVKTDGVDVDHEAIRLARELREAGIAVGVASSSRNVDLVLEAAGLEDLFDTRVDGLLSRKLELRGKPAPDIFLTCLERLGRSHPGEAVVVEDAVSGVEAGRSGGFGLVLGVDRGDAAVRLREHGADWIVPGFQDVTVGSLRSWFEQRRHLRPNALARWPELAEVLAGATPVLFLDYDGTLTPIVDRPDLAVLSPTMRETLEGLAAAWPTTIVSGRGRQEVEQLVGIEGINYAGSHGFDISGPAAHGRLRLQMAEEVVPVVEEAAAEIAERTNEIPGALVEDKRYAVAVHYRLVDEERVPEVERAVDEALAGRPELKKALGKKVFELRPVVPWDKGRAVLWLLEALGLDGPEVRPLYVGDDVTDEDAFSSLQNRGTGVVVTELPRPTAARYSLQNVDEVRELLRRIAGLTAGQPFTPSNAADP